MIYRSATTDDINAVKELCLNHGINPPDNGSAVIFVAESDDALQGVCGVKVNVQIEPLIANTPFVAQILAERAMGFITAISKGPIVVLVKEENEEWISALEKYGFVVTDKNMVVLKKEL